MSKPTWEQLQATLLLDELDEARPSVARIPAMPQIAPVTLPGKRQWEAGIALVALAVIAAVTWNAWRTMPSRPVEVALPIEVVTPLPAPAGALPLQAPCPTPLPPPTTAYTADAPVMRVECGASHYEAHNLRELADIWRKHGNTCITEYGWSTETQLAWRARHP